MDATRIGQQGLTGWRRTVAEPIADRLSRRSRLSAEQAQALIGAAFFAVSVLYVAKAARAAIQAARG